MLALPDGLMTASMSSRVSWKVPRGAISPSSVMSLARNPSPDRCAPIEAAALTANSNVAEVPRPECAERRVSRKTEALFRQSLEGAAAFGRLERLSLTLDGRPIAMLANFITPPGAYSYKTAYDEAYARFSPGVLLQCENLLMLDRADVAWTDSCAAQGHPMIDHIWRERRALGRVSIGIGGKLRRALFAQLLKLELGRKPAGIG